MTLSISEKKKGIKRLFHTCVLIHMYFFQKRTLFNKLKIFIE